MSSLFLFRVSSGTEVITLAEGDGNDGTKHAKAQSSRGLRRNKDPLQALHEMIPVIGDHGRYYMLRLEPCDPEAGS
ncbi:MAG: hypothetical protein LKH81_12430 [Acetobacter sp.]|nr:hypothetical protein [Acetobacter sp.]MCH4061661.1 hypothetical protein [Acetobacter sp.]MCH4089490.1 hypothetical protein [Acetobacter sp.]MCI1321374.1 hypothetical protein [Acetobacter sp.]MCI1374926.1 hypothetical protein [Acetobacter sp.]